jgi:hydrogenase maturation protein HypF
MKNTLCLVRDGDAFLSQHIGEVDSLESLDYFRTTLDHLSRVFKVNPEVIVHDMHPAYLTTRLAHELARERSLPLIAVQHHHAHIAACLAEYGQPGPVIGVSFDGTGYGADGAIWGGEVLVADVKGYQRAAHLEYLPLPGGEAAIRRTYRIAWGYLQATIGAVPDLPTLSEFPAHEREVVIRQVERGINSPLTSSCGRLFDAVAALTGICPMTTFEAQAAIALELAARRAAIAHTPPYPHAVTDEGIIRIGDTLAAIVDDVRAGRSPDEIAAAFHVTLAEIILSAAAWVRAAAGLSTVALSGGVFQNRLLLRLARERLRTGGFHVLSHRQVPTNDGGLSLGQAVIGLHQVV